MKGKFIAGLVGRKVYQTMADEKLLKLYRVRKNNEIINQLFNRYIHLVFGSCLSYLKDEEKAKDASMEIFESLGTKILKHDIRKFKPWLYQVTRNYCLMELRHTKKEIPLQIVEFHLQKNMENTQEDHLIQHESGIEEVLLSFLAKLKLGQRQCLEMMYFQHKSYKEIAVTTGFTEQQVKSYIQNGKRNLKLLLEAQRGGRNEEYGIF